MRPATVPRPCIRHRLPLLAAALLFATAAATHAEESLRYAVVSHGWFQGIELFRDELRDAPADFLAADKRAFASDGRLRTVLFAETVSLEGKQSVKLRGLFPNATPQPVPGVEAPGVSISAERAPGDSAAFTVNAEILQYFESYTDKAGRFIARCQTPARPNVWQEVLQAGSLSLWQYYTPSEYAAAPTTDSGIQPVYRLDIRLGQLSRESLDKLAGYDPEHRRLIAELDWWREIYSIHVSPGVPFHLSSSRCEKSKLSKPDHEPRCTIRIDGSLELTSEYLDLKLGYRNQAQKKEDRLITPLGMEMRRDKWYFQPIENPTPVDYPVEGAWCETTWAEKTYSPCTNVAAYRITKVNPAPAPSEP